MAQGRIAGQRLGLIAICDPKPMVTSVGLLLVAIPLASYALYGLIIRSLARSKTISSRRPNFRPFVSIIIPTYNETKIIRKRVENLDSLNYPMNGFEAIFVDGASKDGTPDLLEQLGRENRPYLRVVRQLTRKGYNAAIYEGI